MIKPCTLIVFVVVVGCDSDTRTPSQARVRASRQTQNLLECTVVGRVVDLETGRPCRGARVEASSTDDEREWEATTGPDGTFSVSAVTSGWVTLSVSTSHALRLSRTWPELVAADETIDFGTIELPKRRRLVIRVVGDADRRPKGLGLRWIGTTFSSHEEPVPLPDDGTVDFGARCPGRYHVVPFEGKWRALSYWAVVQLEEGAGAQVVTLDPDFGARRQRLVVRDCEGAALVSGVAAMENLAAGYGGMPQPLSELVDGAQVHASEGDVRILVSESGKLGEGWVEYVADIEPAGLIELSMAGATLSVNSDVVASGRVILGSVSLVASSASAVFAPVLRSQVLGEEGCTFVGLPVGEYVVYVVGEDCPPFPPEPSLIDSYLGAVATRYARLGQSIEIERCAKVEVDLE